MAPLSNARHERFCQEVFSGKSATDAYVSAGYKATEKVARVNASRLLTNANIRNRIAELQAGAAKRVEITVARFTEDLLRLAKKAEEKDDTAGISAARQAYMDAAKLNGLVIDRKESGGPGEFALFEKMNVDELRAFIAGETEALGMGEALSPEDRGKGKTRRELN